MDDSEELEDGDQVLVGNITYCWNDGIDGYTWCTRDEPMYHVSLYVLVLLSFCYGLISLVAIVGNALVIFIVCCTRSMHNVTNFYIANLAFADVFIAVFCIPFQFYAALLQRWDLPQFMCKFCPFAQTVSVNVSIFTLVTIAVDRYRAIMQPLSEKSSTRTAKMLIVGVWLFSVALALPNLIFFEVTYVFDDATGDTKPFCTAPVSIIDDTNDGTADNSTDAILTFYDEQAEFASWLAAIFPVYNASLGFLQYVLPLFALTFAYVRMGVRLWLTRTPGVAQQRRDAMLLINKRKTIKMLVVVVTVFGICWFPWHVYQLMPYILEGFYEQRYAHLLFFLCHWLAMSNSCYNPFVYAIYSEKFQTKFRECVHCRLIIGRRRGNQNMRFSIDNFTTANVNRMNNNNNQSNYRSSVRSCANYHQTAANNNVTEITGLVNTCRNQEEEVMAMVCLEKK